MLYFKESYIVLGGSRYISGSFDLRPSGQRHLLGQTRSQAS